MSKNTIIGLVLIVAILIGWSVIFGPSKADKAKMKRQQDSLYKIETEQRKLSSDLEEKARCFVVFSSNSVFGLFDFWRWWLLLIVFLRWFCCALEASNEFKEKSL